MVLRSISIKRVVSNIRPFGKRISQRNFSTSNNSLKTRSWSTPLVFIGGASIGGFATYQYYNSQINDKLNSTNPISVLSTLPLDQLKSPNYASSEEIESAIKEIRAVFYKSTPKIEDESILINNSREEIDSHADTYFNSHHASREERPQYVVYPRSTQEVSDIMKICHKYRIPVVPTTGRSSLEGHFIPTRGGIVIDISNMNKVLKLNKTDLDITVQGGLGFEELADYLEEYKLLFGPDPGPGAGIAGIVGTNASGTNATRYGETYKNIINLTVVLADGTIIKTKQRPRKSSAGYNLNSLFIGSEGTLGIVTEATLRLYVKPALESVAVVPFPTIKDAADCVNGMLLEGIIPNATELLDDKMMKVINLTGETTRKWQERPTLFLKLGGSNVTVLESLIGQIKDIAAKNNSKDFQFAIDQDEKEELWSARKVALWSTINHGKEIDPTMQLWTTDAVVPISHLPEFLTQTKQDIDNHGLKNTLVAHIGDGNAHSFILYTEKDREIAEKVVNNMVKRAIEFEGTCTGEHGIGFGKRDFLLEEVGPLPIDLMRKIKLAIDPLRILNPDKVFKIDPNEKPQFHGAFIASTADE
ncbi:mitochondrial enzyme D-lactate ferricytochrome c oxidoreductase [Scheffersomyces amazonensis]|uniref:mitochondrial enzyme D-lactate ferricytochrome c oxidoreductase n=1 Tax=Scheffersomyces amazonensis TaxID=1078765 RepID=UPI00315D4DDE